MKTLELLQEMPDSIWIKWGMNILRFTAPVLAIFFAQLALGVDWKVAGLLALYAFYAALADLFKKANTWGL